MAVVHPTVLVRVSGRLAGRLGPLVAATGLQALLFLVVGGITVFAPTWREPPLFPVAAQPALPSPLLRPQASFAAFRAASSAPARAAVLASTVAWDDLVAAAPPESPSPGTPPSLLAGESALAAESFAPGAEAPPGPAGAEVGMLGLVDRAERVVVAVDVSASVVAKATAAGVPMERVRDEARALVEGLGPGVVFGLVQFSRGHAAFRPGLVPGTARLRAEAAGWLGREFVTDGRTPRGWERGDPDGILAVLALVREWDPDVLYVVSDGSFQVSRGGPGGETVGWEELGTAVGSLRESSAREPRLHFALLRPKPADRDAASRLAATTGGRVRAW